MTTATHPAALSGIPDARAAWPFLLPFGVYILHTLEELPGFAAWATRHFGPESTGTFAAYHIPLILLVLACSWQAARTGRGAWVVAATAFQWQFAVNALFHLSTWVALGDYSPGAVTAATVSLPATAYYLTWLRRHNRASIRQIALAIPLGTLIAAAAIGFLFL
jgi:hypothetical protein